MTSQWVWALCHPLWEGSLLALTLYSPGSWGTGTALPIRTFMSMWLVQSAGPRLGLSFVVTSWNSSMIFEQEILHFGFTAGPTNFVAGPVSDRWLNTDNCISWNVKESSCTMNFFVHTHISHGGKCRAGSCRPDFALCHQQTMWIRGRCLTPLSLFVLSYRLGW